MCRMFGKKIHTKDKEIANLDWKEKNKKYLSQLQRFLDSTDSIEKEETKNNVIAQMLRCDEILTNLAEKEIQKNKLKDE